MAERSRVSSTGGVQSKLVGVSRDEDRSSRRKRHVDAFLCEADRTKQTATTVVDRGIIDARVVGS